MSAGREPVSPAKLTAHLCRATRCDALPSGSSGSGARSATEASQPWQR